MSNTKNKSESLTPVAPHDELPVVTTTGLVQVKNGWVVVKVDIQGDKILDKEILTEDAKPVPLTHAINTYKVDAVKRFIKPHAKAE